MHAAREDFGAARSARKPGFNPIAAEGALPSKIPKERKDQARKVLVELKERSRSGYFPSVARAMVCVGLGERDRAFELLRKSVEERDVNLCSLRVDPQFAPLRSDPRFPELLRLMKLKP